MGNEAQSFLPELGPQEGPQPGPSWSRGRWPLDDGGDLTQAMDPTAMKLVRTYRVRGHLAADLDPLGLTKLELPEDLTPEYHGFTGDALDRPVYLGGTLGFEWGTVREL